jgi:hypothetical protein
MPWGWWVVNAIGTDATSFQDESRVSLATRSAIVDRVSAGTTGKATAAQAITHVRMWRTSDPPNRSAFLSLVPFPPFLQC